MERSFLSYEEELSSFASILDTLLYHTNNLPRLRIEGLTEKDLTQLTNLSLEYWIQYADYRITPVRPTPSGSAVAGRGLLQETGEAAK